MKTKPILLGIGLVLAASGLWVARTAWRAHKQLVTLDVREAPLAEVLRRIERQTWTKIRWEKALDAARITLRVVDKPLSQVLNRIAEQAGAHWSTVYALYDSSPALHHLDAALRADGKPESAGWTKLAPQPPLMDEDGPGGPQFRPPPAMTTDGSGPAPEKRGMMMLRRGPNGPVMFQSSNGTFEMWSPEELVAEAALAEKIGTNENLSATAAAAAETARKVNAEWTTYLAFRKSGMGVGFKEPPSGGPGSNPTLHRPDPNERFANLTPEQRVQQARQRLGFDPNVPKP